MASGSLRNLALKDPGKTLSAILEMGLVPDKIHPFSTVSGLIIWGVDEAEQRNCLKELEEKLKRK